MVTPNKRLARLMTQTAWMLGNAVDDVRLGRYNAEERTHLAAGLDKLATALRDTDQPVIVPGEVRS